MQYCRFAGKKKAQWLDEWLADENYPIVISNDKLAVAPKPKANESKPSTAVVKEEIRKTPAIANKPKKVRKLDRKKLSEKGINTGMLSLNQMLTEEEKVAEEEIVDYSNKPRDSYTQEEFNKAWGEFIDKLNEEKRTSLSSTLLSCTPQLQHEFSYKMIFGNLVQEKEFNNHKTELMGFLRHKLNNWGIQIDTEVKQEEIEKRYYTNRDRFERMVELNPKLAELRKRLNLDPDF